MVVVDADFIAESMKSQQFYLAGCHVGPGNDFDAGRQTALVWSRGNYPAPAKSEILHTPPQPGDSIVVDRSAELDFDRQDTPPFDDQQVDFRACMCPPEEDFGTDQPTSGESREFFDHQALERGAPLVPRHQLLRTAQAGQEVQQAGVPDVELRAFRQTLLHIGMEGLETSDHIRALQHVKIARHRMGRYGEGTREVRDVQKVTMNMGQHRPKSAQPPCGQPQAEGRQVAFEESGDIGVEPFAARAGFPKTVDCGKTAPKPAVRCPDCTCQFRGEEGRKFQQRHPAGQRLGNRTHEGRTPRTQQKETAFSPRAVDYVAKDGEYLRKALGLIDDHRARVRVKKAFQIGSQHGEVGGAFEIEVSPVRECVARKRALAALPWPHEEHGGKRPEEEVKTVGIQSGDVSHTLHFSIQGSKLQGIGLTMSDRPEAKENGWTAISIMNDWKRIFAWEQ